MQEYQWSKLTRLQTGRYSEPALYLIPSTAWLKPNALFVSRDYEGKKSKPEWDLNLSKRNLRLLKGYEFVSVVKNL